MKKTEKFNGYFHVDEDDGDDDGDDDTPETRVRKIAGRITKFSDTIEKNIDDVAGKVIDDVMDALHEYAARQGIAPRVANFSFDMANSYEICHRATTAIRDAAFDYVQEASDMEVSVAVDPMIASLKQTQDSIKRIKSFTVSIVTALSINPQDTTISCESDDGAVSETITLDAQIKMFDTMIEKIENDIEKARNLNGDFYD